MPESSAGQAIRLIAAVEALKGLLAFAAASGLLLFVHEDLHNLAVRLVAHAHLNPGARYPRIFLEAANNLENVRLVFIAAGAAAYSAIRLFEAYGLYFERAWAEWLAALSGGIYIPFEVMELIDRPNAFAFTAAVVNIVIVLVMVRALQQRRRANGMAGAR